MGVHDAGGRDPSGDQEVHPLPGQPMSCRLPVLWDSHNGRVPRTGLGLTRAPQRPAGEMISAAGRIVKCAVTGVHRPTVSGSVLAETRQHTWIRLDGLLLFGFSMPWPTSDLPSIRRDRGQPTEREDHCGLRTAGDGAPGGFLHLESVIASAPMDANGGTVPQVGTSSRPRRPVLARSRPKASALPLPRARPPTSRPSGLRCSLPATTPQ